ncbi:MAG: aminotransferase class I/II-fold pyridoxal phosphate-dependent enzyme [Bacteroidetes bacterium]|nr:aminotransferase class I/II-fold pyridoxal phosphate-dependent enzyme [Bacteroidota bacterium]
MNLKSKLPNAGTTIFTVMSALAREHNAINLSQGFPDFECSPELIKLASNYLKKGYNQYAPMPGVIQLRERISEIMHNCYAATYHPDTEITITAGATQALYTVFSAFLQAGDEVIVFEPCYDSYIPAIELQGAKAVPIQMEYPGFTINWNLVRNAVSTKTKMIVINSPHNPTGTCLTASDMSELTTILKGTDILLLSDEVYEHMVFDAKKHEGVACYSTLRNQSIIVSSFGKTVHTTGWKIGYVAAPSFLMREFRKIHQFLVFAVNHPLQLALADFLQNELNYKDLKHFYEKKRNYFKSLLKNSQFKLEPCNGTYFQLLNYSSISQMPDVDFAKELTVKYKLASIPLSVFYSSKKDDFLLRFCFAKKEETLEKAAEILCRF